MEELTPRDQIPENWLDRIRCPYCSTAPLKIERPAGSPENFSCPSCELAFRVAKADSSIFVLRDPIGTRTGFVGQWVNVKSFAQSMRNQANESQAKQQGAARKPELYASDQAMANEDPIFEKYSAEVIKNAADLYELGHGKGQIRETLSRYSGLRDDEIEEIFEYISRDKTSKAKVNISVPTWAMAAILIPFLCLLFYGIGIFIQYRMASSFEPGDEPRTVSIFQFGNLSDDMKKNVPDSVMDISMPVPVITPLDVTGGEIAACPLDAEAAVALYGAEVDDWQYHGLQKTWRLQSAFAEQITIPEGHLAVIPTIHEGISIRLIPGPVVINNSYLVMVRCP
jgi:hypothetical protein